MTTANRRIVVSGGFDDLDSRDLRFLQEASKLGRLCVLIWSDAVVQQRTGRPPRFPLAERRYLLAALRYVDEVVEVPDALPEGIPADLCAVREGEDRSVLAAYCRSPIVTIPEQDLNGFPEQESASSGRRKVIVTGCFDWFHSGHVRFFEEASAYGDLYVVVGNDANIRLLKGEGHPLIAEQERRYVVGSARCVHQALISTGSGWLDAEPEIARLKPDFYVVNEDGDKGGKREFCAARGIEYVVLKRAPAPGLPRRSSTDLRGF